MVIKGVICGIPSNTTGANILSQVYTILLKKKKKKKLFFWKKKKKKYYSFEKKKGKKRKFLLKFLKVLHFISTGKNSQ